MIQGSFDMMKKKSNDKISELPESLLHHILSFLPYKAVARTSVLSKIWERAWRTYPVLVFDHFTVFREYSPFFYNPNLDKDGLIRRNVLFNRLAETMRNRRCRDMVSIKEFTLELVLFKDREFASFVDQCICHAVGCNVKKLKLLFASGHIRLYNLPQILFFSNSIEDMELKRCRLELPRNTVKLSSLRKLSLKEVYMDDHTVKNLVCGCPLIEYLGFVLCEGFKSLELFGPITLNEIKIVRCQEVERLDINALNVRFLGISGATISRKVNIAFCKSLTQLKLYGAPIKDEWFYTQISKLSILEVLNVSFGEKLKNVKISNPCLKELKIFRCLNLVELNIDTPNLRSLCYEGKMIFLSANALALSEISLNFVWSKNVESLRYIEFLTNFHHFSEVLRLHIDMSEMNVMVPSEVRETTPSPLSNLEVLNLVCYGRPTVFTIAKVVDSLLWFAPHTKTISVNRDEFSFEFQFTYKKQLIYEGEIVSCCKSLPISCWHHCVEAVKVVFKEGSNKIKYCVEAGKFVFKEDSNKIKYSLNGADIWEKIVALSEVWQRMESA